MASAKDAKIAFGAAKQVTKSLFHEEISGMRRQRGEPSDSVSFVD